MLSKNIQLAMPAGYGRIRYAARRPMKRLRPLVAITIALLVVYLVFRVTSPVVYERAASPDRTQLAVAYHMDEASGVPYGVAIVVEPFWLPLPEWWAEPIFQGDCGGPEILRWRSPTELLIGCSYFDRIQVQVRERGVLSFEYVESR